MSFFKRKDKFAIPPIAEIHQNNARPGPAGNSTSPRPTRSNTSTYVPSRDGDPYSAPTNRAPLYPSEKGPQDEGQYIRDRYSRNNSVGDVHSQGGAQLNNDRNELFSGYKKPANGGSERFFDGPDIGKEPALGEENDEDVEGIKQQTRSVKQESVNSTRNALRLAREAEETARNTRLGDQSGMFHARINLSSGN